MLPVGAKSGMSLSSCSVWAVVRQKSLLELRESQTTHKEGDTCSEHCGHDVLEEDQLKTVSEMSILQQPWPERVTVCWDLYNCQISETQQVQQVSLGTAVSSSCSWQDPGLHALLMSFCTALSFQLVRQHILLFFPKTQVGVEVWRKGQSSICNSQDWAMPKPGDQNSIQFYPVK